MSANLVFRFSGNKLPFSLAIKAATWSKYSHIDLVIEPGLYFGAIPFHGVGYHKKKYNVEDYFELVLPTDAVNAFDLQLEIRRWILSQEGKPYDYSGILGFAARRDWQEDDSWFCSELMAAGINKYFPMFNEEAHRISPRDLAIHGVLKRLDPAVVLTRFPESQDSSHAT